MLCLKALGDFITQDDSFDHRNPTYPTIATFTVKRNSLSFVGVVRHAPGEGIIHPDADELLARASFETRIYIASTSERGHLQPYWSEAWKGWEDKGFLVEITPRRMMELNPCLFAPFRSIDSSIFEDVVKQELRRKPTKRPFFAVRTAAGLSKHLYDYNGLQQGAIDEIAGWRQMLWAGGRKIREPYFKLEEGETPTTVQQTAWGSGPRQFEASIPFASDIV